MNNNLRVAIVHYWLTLMAGAGYTLQRFLTFCSKVHITTMVDFLSEKERGWLKTSRILNSHLQSFSFLAKSASSNRVSHAEQNASKRGKSESVYLYAERRFRNCSARSPNMWNLSVRR